MAAKKFDPKKNLRDRVGASEKFAKRDNTYTAYYESTGKPYKVTPKRGEYINLYDDVSSLYNTIKTKGSAGYGGGDFPMDVAKKNTYKGKQFLPSGLYGVSYPKTGKAVKYGTVAGPKTAINYDDMAKARKKNEVRDRAIKQTRRKGGK